MSTGRPPLGRIPPAGRWLVLVVLSALAIVPLARVHLPAAVMLGAMVAAIAVQIAGGDLRLPRRYRIPAEGLLGGLIAQAISPTAVATFLGDAPLFLATGLAIVGLSTLVGWALQRTGGLPGPTAIWGLSPGAATVMMLMSGAYGADERLVAFMQYLRVLLVAIVAPLVAHFWAVPAAGAMAAGAGGGAGFDALGFAETLAIVAAGLVAARRLAMPGGTILLPFALGGLLHAAGAVTIVLPDMLMSACYIVLGWSVGQNFSLPVLRHALATLPQILTAILTLIGLCGGLAAVLVLAIGVDPLSAYLATSPGGLSSVAIIAATSRVDLAFVMAMQTLRFVLVLLLGPPIARHITARAARRAG